MTEIPADLKLEEPFPGAREPERRCLVDAGGLSLSVVEWGEASAPPLLLAHGGADFARTFDVFGPLLADGGYRVVAWDHRGHGDSERADLYSWAADLRDAFHVLRWVGGNPLPVVGHSKGAGILANLCTAMPERFTHYVNIDGVPWRSPRRQEKRPLAERVARRARWHSSFLDSRRQLRDAERRPGSLLELARRRARHNPRLDIAWLLHLAKVGARESEDGWRWKLDPLIRMDTPGPWRPEWGLAGMKEIRVPMLALLGRIPEPMGWGTDPDAVAPFLAPAARIEVFDDSGHFVHVEHPERTARSVLEFLA